MTPEDLARVNDLLARIGGANVSWGAASLLEVWIAESRMEDERRSARPPSALSRGGWTW